MPFPSIKKFVLNDVDLTNYVSSVQFVDRKDNYEYQIVLPDYYIFKPISRTTTFRFEFDDIIITQQDAFDIEIITNITGTTLRLRKSKV